MGRMLPAIGLILLLLGEFSDHARADDVLLSIEDVPSHGLVVARVDLTEAARWCKTGAVDAAGISAAARAGGQAVPFQFVPDEDFDGQNRIAGTVVLRLPEGSDTEVRLTFDKAESAAEKDFDGTVTTPSFVVKHDAGRMGGLPSSVTFPATGKVFENLLWSDRPHHPDVGGFLFRDDPQPKVELLSKGPLCTVVRVWGRYMRDDGTRPPSQPEATYDWYYFHDRPLVYVTAMQHQREPFVWREWHFLELHAPGDDFMHWAGGEPLQEGQFKGAKKGFRFDDWAALVEGQDAIAVLRSGSAMIYDGRGGYGPYLHAHSDLAWSPFGGARRRQAGWLWMGSDKQPVAAIQAAVKELPTDAHAAVTVDAVRAKIAALRDEAAGMKDDQRRQASWRVAGAEQLLARGRFKEALQAAGGEMPAAWKVLAGGDLCMILEQTPDGVRILNLFDSASNRQLLASQPLPLFSLTLRHARTKEEIRLAADVGWKKADIRLPAREGIDIDWQQPKDERLGNLRVVARATPDHRANALRWSLKVDNDSDQWIVRRVVFPQLAVGELGPQAEVLFPRGPGEVQTGVWRRPFRFHGTYPGGWTCMQFMAAYDRQSNTGLYVATHDPWGSTKDINVEGRPADRAVVLAVDHPAADMDSPGNDFELAGEAVWQLLRGDWFDAAIIYRDWARKNAKWFPKLTADGREDTPLWMRELPVWVLGGGAPGSSETVVKEFARSVGVPVGLHWYNWHQIPFDNDYPHYFPTKKGFAESVRDLQAAGVYVMPYINGRLWDTRDKGVEDFQFTSVARPAATKDENGEPRVEMYGSKETDGSRVSLAAMCPTTDVWRNKVRDIVGRLFGECGVKGVYIDQVAAAQPVLCFDKTHGHPSGGGHWWTEGYWRFMDDVRRAKPDDRMLTTECNAETYVRWFDGYLTWHWQHQGQVPAFPAIYGGAIQMFGRAYRGGPTRDLALRMKAGQQFVFGEQIGWFDANLAQEKENAEFLRPIIQLRWRLRRYFYAGEMARPPKLVGRIPTVRADWQWAGNWPVSTPAVMTGAWHLPREKRLVLLAVNVGDEPVTARLEYDATPYGFTAEEIRVTPINPEAAGETFTTPPAIHREITFPARSAWAWELTPE